MPRPRKLPVYARERVRHVWFVAPIVRTLEVLRVGSDGWTLIGTWAGDARVRTEPIEAFELELGISWQGAVLSDKA